MKMMKCCVKNFYFTQRGKEKNTKYAKIGWNHGSSLRTLHYL